MHSLRDAFMQRPFLLGRELREIGESDDVTLLAVVGWMYAEGLLGAGPANERLMDHVHNAKPNIPALRIDRVQSSADIAVLADLGWNNTAIVLEHHG